ncbi:MAG: DUF4278 domain-containing protein [Richelia sp. RM2_1_2]|nr:DUF4278 domain-containing protein [Richelia sp. SM1_7_0]NJN08225.1 DUF4278 domain-containing protein [Richelia sp. RM1_1_1]NJO28052.1 DUF4278 domain-containing protein [Richelia sp. SL_2_1]NJO61130.1 DUF4278 domain-containing protein [Richelia sp. RM2_1_2]
MSNRKRNTCIGLTQLSHYEANTKKLATKSNQLNAKYRGISYQIPQPILFPNVPKSQFKYRGVNYIYGSN